MAQLRTQFPDGFLWGASLSAFQCEGAFDEDGRGLSLRDVCKLMDDTKYADNSVTSDFYHHYKEDIKMFGEMGLKVLRMSISWSRVMPDGRTINPKGVEFYDHVFDCLIENHIQPIVTLMHYDQPMSLTDEGGWMNRKMIDDFVNYADFLFDRYQDKVKYWVTFNEQNCFIFDPKLFFNTNEGKLDEKTRWQIYHNMLVASSKTMVLCHEKYPGLKIGPVPNVAIASAASCDPSDIIAADNMNSIQTYILLDAQVYGVYNSVAWSYLKGHGWQPKIEPGDMEIMKQGHPDFIAFNYYGTALCRAASKPAREDMLFGPMPASPDFYASEFGNPYFKNFAIGANGKKGAIDGDGLRYTLRVLDSRYHLPLIITENGFGQRDVVEDGDIINDDYRIDVLNVFIDALYESITSDGVQLMGYCPWSALDVVSLHEGINKRYGFIYVNRDELDLKDLRRIKKKSFFWYKKLIETNGKER